MKKRFMVLALMAIFVCGSVCGVAFGNFSAKAESAANLELSALRENQGIVYFVNNSKDGESYVEGSDKIGLYQTYLDQNYGIDSKSGYSWGRKMAEGEYGFTESWSFDKNKTNVYAEAGKDIIYQFQLPEGKYNVTLGLMDLSWGNRSTKVFMNGTEQGTFDILRGKNREFNYPIALSGSDKNDLTIRLTKADENQADPYISFIVIRKVFDNDRYYTAERMYDTDGKVIQAHGGAIYEFGEGANKKFYWYGEDKTDYVLPYVDDGSMENIYTIEGIRYGSYSSGVKVYTSTDMYNWTDEGSALQTIKFDSDLENVEYFKNLYGNSSEEIKTAVKRDLHKGRSIIERPKVIYNAKTDKYVMWFHADGPDKQGQGGWHSYYKASLAVAISDSPTGPFKYDGLREMHADADHVQWVHDHEEEKYWDSAIGGGRDMTVFLDDDGTGYVVYASEGNASMYVSKLNDDFTDVVTTPTSDGSQGLSGVDYKNVLKSQGRESPAIFKYNSKYYMVTSGLTGWAPNRARYFMADNMFGPWADMGDPCEGGSGDTFYSQSTAVMPINAANGEFFYMGDRWYEPSNQGDIDDSRYIWLPIQFDAKGRITIPWRDTWKNSDLQSSGSLVIRTELKTQVALGEEYALPERISVSHGVNGTSMAKSVRWDDYNFNNPGVLQIQGTLTDYDNKTVYHNIAVVPVGTKYFINAGGGLDSDFAIFREGTQLLNDVQDQEFSGAATWGYTNSTALNAEKGEDIYSSVRFVKSSTTDRSFSYKLNLEQGGYKFYLGLFDPWYQYSKGARKADIEINGTRVGSDVVIGDVKSPVVYNQIVDGGTTEIKFAPSNSGENTDVMVSFIIVVKMEVSAVTWETEPKDKVYDGTAVTLGAKVDGGTVSYKYFAKVGNLWNALGDQAPTNAGTYKVVADAVVTDGYISGSIEKVFTISKATLDVSGLTLNGGSFVYDGNAKRLAISGDIPDGLTVEYEGNSQTNAGTYTVKAILTGDKNHAPLSKELEATMTITKAVIDMSGVTFDGLTFKYDGEQKTIGITGKLPDGVTVEYENNGKTEVGEYIVTAKFSSNNDNYEPIDNMTATLKIEKESGCKSSIAGDTLSGGMMGVFALVVAASLLFIVRKKSNKNI